MQKTKSVHAGSILGGSLLIAGSCIGAGMLGLPVISAQAGFIPSLFMLLLSWIFMVLTGLLVLEVNLWFNKEVSFVSMAKKTLGPIGATISWVLFLFLFYTLMVAFLVGSGALISEFIALVTGINVPIWISNLVLTLLFGLCVYMGTRAVDDFNRLLMLGLIISYLSLVVLGIPNIHLENLMESNLKALTLIVPVMIISFGYHNLIPSLNNYFEGDVKRLRWTIILGSGIPMVVYIVWEALVLGMVPLKELLGAVDNGLMANQILRNNIDSAYVTLFTECFAFFAIVTSFLGVALSFVDFLADGLKIKKTASGKLALCLLVLAPPYLVTVYNPQLFLVALNYAGAFGAVILFGVLPALMVWVGRYTLKLGKEPLVPGGKTALALIIAFAAMVSTLQLAHEFGWDPLKKEEKYEPIP